MDLEQRADELYESWVNGNRKDVIHEITHHGSCLRRSYEAATLAVLVCMRMSEREAHTFRSMLMSRVDS